MSSSTSRDELRRRVEGWRAAERKEREVRVREGIPSPEDALAAGLELCALDPIPPGQPDPIRDRDVERVRSTWAKLRRGLGWLRNGAQRS